ncbi:MAG: phosphonoacetate hydrolase [Nitrospiraceae bacterium]|jgi:phosphonoacetate hydrolase|nr:phosphonoacetate hydrolase [Nitrospiraceae bacterium]
MAHSASVSDGKRSSAAHPRSINANGKAYRWPDDPLVVVCLDGGQPEYIEAALDRNLVPNISAFMRDGFAAIAEGAMPSFTNPNNISIISGVPPSVHGISGNYFLDPETGEAVMMNEARFLRAESLLAVFSEHGAKVASITAKDKLSRMLSHGVKGGIAFSAEKADECSLAENGIENCLDYVGMPLPDVYSADLSLFVLEAGVKVLERERPDIMYLSLTDYIQHKHAPGSPEANEFYQKIDNGLGRLSRSGAIVAITGDHGMNDKSRDDGAPNVIYLQDVLEQEFGTGESDVILPITDPYVVHHGALGSFASVFIRNGAVMDSAVNSLRKLPGVEEVMKRETAAQKLELPADRIGDIVVIADKETVLGKRAADHDLSLLGGMRLRSHGGLADRQVFFILSRPLNNFYQNIAQTRQLLNYEIFDFALNGLL